MIFEVWVALAQALSKVHEIKPWLWSHAKVVERGRVEREKILLTSWPSRNLRQNQRAIVLGQKQEKNPDHR